jgi:hypothetical protein
MRAFVLVAALAALLLVGPAPAQSWQDNVAALANTPAEQRDRHAQRMAEAFMGPRPAGATARAAHDQRVAEHRQLLLHAARDFRAGVLAPAQREQEHARLRTICEGHAQQARDYWPAFHACWAQHSRR